MIIEIMNKTIPTVYKPIFLFYQGNDSERIEAGLFVMIILLLNHRIAKKKERFLFRSV
jgi:hypothetical protein